MKNINQSMGNGSYQAPIPAPVEPMQPAAVSNFSEKPRFSHVRIHYWQNAIYQGFCRNSGRIILRSPLHKADGIFCHTLQPTMNNQSQSQAKARPVARSEALNPSASAVAAHKHLADTKIVFGVQCGRKLSNAFCACGAPLPVCLRAGFQFGGRINDRTRKDTLFHFGTEPFENQLKSVLCLVP
jgi:hypothetical protein